jgi:hypothetical protein
MKDLKVEYNAVNGFVEMHISIDTIRSISLTGEVLTPPCPTLLWDSLAAGVIGIQLFFKRV